jgi:hypothetical protein
MTDFGHQPFVIAVWNMSHWENARTHGKVEASWERLADLGADVALVQEAVVPRSLSDNSVGRIIGGARPWGSAVVGFTVEVRPLASARGRAATKPTSITDTLPGSLAVATCMHNGQRRTLISMYGMIDNGYADSTVHRQLSDLVPVLDSAEHEGEIILGGDLNITTQWVGNQRRYRDWESVTFARIRIFGLDDCLDISREIEGPWPDCDCLDGPECRHIHTQAHRNSSRPWHNTYVYASTELVSEPTTVFSTIHRDEAWLEFGGHFPITVTIRSTVGEPLIH